MYRLTFIVLLALNCTPLFGQTTNFDAPGAPGKDAHWPTAAKQGFGTSNTLSSKVWFTLAQGMMTEVFYPTLDVPNVQSLQLIVVMEDKVEVESEDMSHRINVASSHSLTFQQTNRSRQGSYRIRKTYVSDPAVATVLIDIEYENRRAADVYVYFDPTLNKSGLHDTAWSSSDALLASDGEIATALVSDCGIDTSTSSNGYLGTSDGLTELRKNSQLKIFQKASNGNVVQVAKLKLLSGGPKRSSRCTLALGFGANDGEALAHARRSLRKGFNQIRQQYETSWHGYVTTLPRVAQKYQAQLNTSAMVLKALEDKTYPGAMIASPSNPWGAGPNANEPTTTGYHAVWSRDLYHVATAFLALGDTGSANRALDYLFRIQQKGDGSFPQNSHLDGRAIGRALQMDQVAYPLILAYQLKRTDTKTWLKRVKPAADFILKHGPGTEQERWEEERGFSPATIAAEIAGLVCAAYIARLNNDHESEKEYLDKADNWARDLESWTATSTGPWGHYYIRITENPNPNDGATVNINSGGGDHDEREIIDAGFLELVRLGIKRADDPLIKRSLDVVDRLIRIETRFGSAFYRYNRDGYGERDDGGAYDGRSGRGRPWPLLTGERGEYELALGNVAAARRLLDVMSGFANEGRMIPEQVWDRETDATRGLLSGEGTGSATPLGWAMAQYIRLVMNIKSGRNLETPRVVVDRYQARSR